ncbi:2Fe-2S iron-sulfur cluster-binding protein [Acidovorax sp. sic0104]|uniref:2Fe-2S iron-sulfur cluster-binding protein n=1 Tax=Acidovorax sp. sic0104 TaxID=2854784 RepID=UPI001C464001|nr:2Fe-2S iron-sulfur cluster-binding protein [Acidovorax sp. sic0104]MBV7543889.1 (2Fe-2S)-binding protein [Acidovorax sp. sic0104]
MNDPATITLTLDGQTVRVALGTTVAAALAQALPPGATHRSVRGEVRAPLCGMGICHECRVQIDGVRRLACQTLCRDGMQVQTGLQPLEAAP